MHKTFSFKVTGKEHDTINAIADRAMEKIEKAGLGKQVKKMTVLMDLTVLHANGTPLRLDEFLAADDFNFTHDIFGIIGNMNRETGELERGFMPRFAQGVAS